MGSVRRFTECDDPRRAHHRLQRPQISVVSTNVRKLHGHGMRLRPENECVRR